VTARFVVFYIVALLALAPSLLRADEPDAAEVELTYARKLQAKGYHDLALLVLQDFLEANPDHGRKADVLQAAAGLQFKLGDFQAARRAYEELLTQKPSADRTRLLQRSIADCHWAEGDFGRALDLLQTVLREATDLSAVSVTAQAGAKRREIGEVKFMVASCLAKLERHAEAVAALTEFLRDFSDLKPAAAAQAMLGDCQMALGQFQAALKAYQRARDMADDAETAARALYGIGRARYEMGELAASAVAFEALVAQSGEAGAPKAVVVLTPTALWSLARVREKQGDAPRQLAAAGQIVERFPDAPEASQAFVTLGRAVRQRLQAQDAKAEALSENELFAVAELEAQEGSFRNARDIYAQLLARFPNGQRTGVAQFKLGQCLLSLREFAEAAEALEKAAQRASPQTTLSADARYHAALAHYSAGNLKAMARCLDGLLEAHPRYDKADHVTCLLGDACFAAKRYAEAADAYQKTLVRFPTSRHAEDALYRLAYSLYLAKDYPTAAESFRQFAERFPGSPNASQAQFLMGASLAQAGWLDDAEKALKSYLVRFPKDAFVAKAHYHLGQISEARKETTAALAAYAQSRAADPASEVAGEAMRRTGVICFTEQRFAEARRAFGVVVREYPRTALPAAVYEWLAAQLTADGQWADAQKCYELLIEHYSGDAAAGRSVEQAHFALGQQLLRQDKWAAAASAFSELVAKYPESSLSPRAKLHVAECYRRTGDADKAVACLRELSGASLDPRTAAEAHFELASGLRDLGDVQNAVKMFERVTLLYASPENADWVLRSYVAQGECLERLGQPKAALKAYERARGITPIPPEVAPLRKKAEMAVQRLRKPWRE